MNKKKNTMLQLIESRKNKIEEALGNHASLNADKLIRVVSTDMRKNPKLGQCSPESILGAVIQAATVGLEPGGVLGHCYLVPYWNHKRQSLECQFLLGYRGMIKLARQSGEIANIEARVVYENDRFDICYGTESRIDHQPCLDGDPGLIKGVYGLAKLTSGEYYMEWMPLQKIEEIRTRSKSSNDGPWQTDYEEMAKKTVVRRMFKYLPVGDAEQKAAQKEEQDELGVSDPDIIESTGEVVNMSDHSQKQQVLTVNDLNKAL
ncbi:recombinase RecT [Endozoicomonas sp. Mp262]|uniref:recombinase RecT n=1 Tax=Endozoicomonas sp. Mp262 TaxID=2919499 RepID=UPI0021DA9011